MYACTAAEACVSRGSIECARAIVGHALSVFPNKKALWLRAAELEKRYESPKHMPFRLVTPYVVCVCALSVRVRVRDAMLRAIALSVMRCRCAVTVLPTVPLWPMTAPRRRRRPRTATRASLQTVTPSAAISIDCSRLLSSIVLMQKCCGTYLCAMRARVCV
jgi:hypothetical protein